MPHVWKAASGLPEVRHLPHLFPQVRGPGADSGCPKVELVEGTVTKMMTDPIADMLTQIRNAVRVERSHVEMPASRLKRGLADVLKREGYIWDWQEVASTPAANLRIELKYGPNGERVIQRIRRVSKPGRRVYSRARDLKPILNGLGIQIISTSRGVISDREARQRKLGGEVLCEIW